MANARRLANQGMDRGRDVSMYHTKKKGAELAPLGQHFGGTIWKTAPFCKRGAVFF